MGTTSACSFDYFFNMRIRSDARLTVPHRRRLVVTAETAAPLRMVGTIVEAMLMVMVAEAEVGLLVA